VLVVEGCGRWGGGGGEGSMIHHAIPHGRDCVQGVYDDVQVLQYVCRRDDLLPNQPIETHISPSCTRRLVYIHPDSQGDAASDSQGMFRSICEIHSQASKLRFREHRLRPNGEEKDISYAHGYACRSRSCYRAGVLSHSGASVTCESHDNVLPSA
jgi:hypothetical protein